MTYVGDAAYLLALVMGGLSVASRIGATVSAKLLRIRVLSVVSFATATMAIVMWLGFTATMQLPLARCAAIVLTDLLPAGILLGIPFPTAVYPTFIAWARV
jgi:hypothetical protein